MYSPFLKSKQSEGLALQRLEDDVRESVLPMIDLAAPTTSKQKEDPPAHVEKNIKSLSRYLGSFARVMIDSSEMDADIRTPNGDHPILAAARALYSKNIDVVPVTGLDRDNGHLDAVATVIKEIEASTIGIRIDQYDLATPTITAKRLKDLLAERFEKTKFILVYDLRTVFGADIDTLKARVVALDEKIVHDQEEMTVVTGSGLPERMAEAVPTKSAAYITRIERNLWSAVKESIGNERKVIFGDYATVTPDYVEVDFALIYKQIGPKIIYALDDDWFVIRGGSFEHHPDGRDQYYAIAKEVTKLEDFSGKDYCFGDFFIDEKANHVGTTGSPSSWVTACVNRHISTTARSMV